jgi:hypothetical protein
VVRVICSATRTEPYHIGRMFTYDVTVTGPLGFQVSVTGPYVRGTSLIGDFGSLQEAEVFADRMREIDARGGACWPWSDQPTLTGLTTLTGCWTGWSGWTAHHAALA